ncbi:MAG: succinate dehydrogenase cytochrome b subunit [Verrucomicrobia bacterium]|nr:succinate dehydrogenase cytochrome b subunit [Verrucomicrobiota bacterium]
MSDSSCQVCRPSSVGKKVVMAITGLVLAGFVLGHMSGNLLMFKGPAAIDAYAAWLHANPLLLWTSRIVLLLSAAAHVWAGVTLTLENRAARDGGPSVDATRRATLGSRTMPYTGLVLLAFIVFHLLHYTFQAAALGGQKFDSVYRMVVTGFSSAPVSVFYVVSMLLLCLHLGHGFSSLFQTLGLRNERWRGRLDRLSLAYAWIVALGFVSIPVAVLAGILK